MGAGKTTLSKEIKEELSAVLISEDDWLSTIYPEEIKKFNDYVHYSARF